MKTTPPAIASPFDDLQLGDLLVLPDASKVAVRCKVQLPAPTYGVASFVMGGDFAVLLAAANLHEPVQVYMPLDHPPVMLKTSTERGRGLARYWAPHLPALSGAMAQIQWRMLTAPREAHPMFVMQRGPEAVFFVRSSQALPEHMAAQRMNRVDNEVEVTRFGATVDSPSPAPASQPAPSLYERFAGSR